MKRPSSLYVHIPFCRHLCAYCDFPKVFYKEEWAKSYLGALFCEIKSKDIGKLKTIYVGGGTPTSLEAKDLESLLLFLRDYLDEDYEFSIEANPETLDEEKAKTLASCGVNRVSIGMQTASPRLLEKLGRRHTFEDVEKAVGFLRSSGIANINIDLMYGLPEENMEEVQADLEAFFSLGVPHVSAYSLILEQGTSFYVRGVKPLDDDAQQAQFEYIRDCLEKHCYARYEISNFARPGCQCRHNKTYWKDEPYYGVGLGAAGYVGKVRYVNTKNLRKYLAGECLGEEETLDEASEIEDFLLTNLRLVEGFDPAEFEARFRQSFSKRFGEKAARLLDRGLLYIGEDAIRATSRGLDLLDTVLVALF